MARTEKIYTPSPWGARFHATTEWEVMGGGSAGPGKTTCLKADPLYQYGVEAERCRNRRHPHHIRPGSSRGLAVLFRREKRMLDSYIHSIGHMLRTIEPGIRWNGETLTWTSFSGFRYQLGHCKDEGDEEAWQSQEITWLGLDELTQFLESQYLFLIRRVRTDDPVLERMLKVRSMTNPLIRRVAGDSFSMRDPQWVRRRFVDANPPTDEERIVQDFEYDMGDGTTVIKSRLFLPALIDDNPNKSFVRQYKANLASETRDHVRQALLHGDWYATADSYYGDVWDTRVHVCKPFEIPSHWVIFRSMDWGYKSPGCVHWYAKDPDGSLYVIYELTFRLKPIRSDRDQVGVADLMKSIEKRLGVWKGGSKISGAADTQLWEQREGGTKTKAQEFSESGISWHPADKKSRSDNARRVHALLADHANYTRPPGLVIFSICRDLIRTIPQVSTDPDSPEEPADGGDDHWTDSLWYGCASAARFTKVSRADDEEDDDEKPKKPKTQGSWGYGFGYR